MPITDLDELGQVRGQRIAHGLAEASINTLNSPFFAAE
jgi:hypothetical protein